jgi:glycosyltransferase involved in cell wall biosynthesis
MVDSLERPGGGERLAIENAIRVDPARFRRRLCLTRWEDRFEREEPARSMIERLEEAGVEVIRIRRERRFALTAWRPLVRLLRSGEVDVLHAHLFGSNVWASVIGTLTRTPAIVAHEHMWAYAGGGSRSLIDRHLIARLSDAFIAVSRAGERSMIEAEGIPEDAIVYVPNGIAPLPPGDGPRLRRDLGIEAGAPVIGSVGHLRAEKAYDVLIEAAAALRDRHPGLRVLIAGEGPERESLEALRSKLGLEGTVLMPGPRDDVADVLAAIDVAVCCSDFEGGPLSVMEYMAAGRPVVATRVGGLPELVRDGETGVLVDPRDPDALADAAGSLLGDPALRERLGERGREVQRAEYDIDVWAGRLERLYADLLSGRGTDDRSRVA